MRPGIRRGALISWTIVFAVCFAAQGQVSARPLTVRVFSSRVIASLTIEPGIDRGNWLRACAGCRKQSLRAPLTAKARAGSIVLSNGMRLRAAELEGSFRMRAASTGGGATEIAAAGVWKLTLWHGEMRVLLTLDSERYVAFALSGEAAPNEPLESLKAMAIAVRTYTFENAGRHASEGFNLCDSTHCQALRFGRPSPEIEAAVLDTTGETLWYQGKRAMVFYTQNCGGESEAASDLWPRVKAPYLVAHRDPYCVRRQPSRWQAEIPLSAVAAVARQQGWRMPEHIEAVRILKRTGAGRAEDLEFDGAGPPARAEPGAQPGDRAIVSAGSLRFAVDRSLGWNQIRSDWYTVSLANGILSFDGRGYGHGVGLCQAGAFEMAAEGHDFRSILGFYFPGTAVGITPGDYGWQRSQANGLTLWTANSSATLRKQAEEAWEMAQTLFRSRAPVQAALWQFPTTELFRQASGEPGWIAASTQGTQVFLQPESVLARYGDGRAVLLHEFLHVLVEAEAAPQAPLWLREGLVEALPAEAWDNGTGMKRPDGSSAPPTIGTLQALDAALAHPADEAASQRAHAQAAMLARLLLARYGLAPIRQWLRDGAVPADALHEAAIQSALYEGRSSAMRK